MTQLRFLNKKEQKEIFAFLEKQWGFTEKLDYVFVLSEKEKVYMVNNTVKEVDFSKIRVNSLGSYFGKKDKGGFRLSIEGSQLIGPKASKGVLEISEKEMHQWMTGVDLDKDVDEKSYVIIKYGDDYLGCGKAVEGKVLNFVPKIRRLNTVH